MADTFKNYIYPVFFMAVITVLFIGAIGGIYLLTRDMVSANESIVMKKAVLYAAGMKVPENNQEINDYFSRYIKEKSGNKSVIYEVNDSTGSTIAYVAVVDGPGLWGNIRAAVGYNHGVLTGIDFIAQNETPGLGARIGEKWFKEQFRGKKLPVKMVPEGAQADIHEVDGITGATRTSNFVRNIVNSVNTGDSGTGN